MKAPVDLHIPGDTGAITGLADRVTAVGKAIGRLSGSAAEAERNVQYFWEGDTVRGFQTAAVTLMGAYRPIDTYAADAADVFEAYADRIIRGRHAFADYADAAAAAGMTVVGKRHIRPPEPPGTDANGDCVPVDARAQSEYEKAVRLFTEIERLVETWWTDTRKWITSHFGPLVARIGEFDALDAFLKNLQLNGFTVAGAMLDEAAARVSDRLGDFVDRQRGFEDAYEKFKSDGRSGDPARNAAAEDFDRKGNRTALESIEKNIDLLKPGKVLLRVGGPASGVIEAAVELAGGASPSSVGAGAAGGGVGAWILGSAAASTVSGPLAPIVVGAAALAGAVGGNAASKTAWQEWVPLRTRDAIDAGLSDPYRLGDAYDTRIKPPKTARG
ncbi:hypothetical protein [Leucobacter iarius]|uniref:WXG100 family type VII secretion target n=1 Tax=Leucobacter iarius TaxID=333963 RepID=A0ABN2LNN4_9MICO